MRLAQLQEEKLRADAGMRDFLTDVGVQEDGKASGVESFEAGYIIDVCIDDDPLEERQFGLTGRECTVKGSPGPHQYCAVHYTASQC